MSDADGPRAELRRRCELAAPASRSALAPEDGARSDAALPVALAPPCPERAFRGRWP